MAYRPKYAQSSAESVREHRKTEKWGKAVAVLCVVLTAFLLSGIFTSAGTGKTAQQVNTDIMAGFDRYIEDQISYALSGVEEGKQVYRLSDKDLIAPKPVPEGYGAAETAGELARLLEDAAELLEGQDTLFTPETQVKDSFGVRYYLDETIFAVTWKQEVEDCTYTFSEVKVAHASQFRRFLSEGVYGSGVQRTTTEMAESVNAVVASSGDYYEYRSFGIVVNDGQVYRAKGELLDTCYIDENGDMLFTYAREITDQETAQRYVDDNDIRFSLSFGPVMIEDGEVCVPAFYNSGEINKDYARSALCQMGPLHYVIVTANMEDPCYSVPTVRQFAENLWEMGVPRAYALDGGQTAAIAMDNELINTVSYGCQREISDIIYFATALPEQR